MTQGCARSKPAFVVTRRVHIAALLVVLLAVGVRLSLPDGWMLDPARGFGAPLMLCPDAGPAPAAHASGAHGHGDGHAVAMDDGHAGHAAAPEHGSAGHDEHAGGAPPVCPFAGAALPVVLDTPALFAASAVFPAPVLLRASEQAAPAAAAPRRAFHARAPPESGRA